MDRRIENVVGKILATDPKVIRVVEVSPTSVLLELRYSTFIVHLDERINSIDIELKVEGEQNGPLTNITHELVLDLLDIECDFDELLVEKIDSALGEGRISAAEIRAYFLGFCAGHASSKQ